MNKLRMVLAVLCTIIFLGIVLYTICAWSHSAILKDKVFNNLVGEAIKLKLDQSRSEFQLMLLIFGVLWGLLIAKKEEEQILFSNWPVIIMFTFANLLLIGSFVFHILYIEWIGKVYSIAGGINDQGTKLSIPDVFNSEINNPYRFQILYLIAGIFNTTAAFISAHILKNRKQ